MSHFPLRAPTGLAGSFQLAVAWVIVAAAPAAIALPSLSLDVTGGTAGIDDFVQVDTGDQVSVDVVIEGLDAGAGEFLNAFELDLVFDPTLLSVTSVTPGSTLIPPTFVVQNSVGAMTVDFAEVSLLPAGTTADGLLVSVTFDAIAEGTSAVALDNVVLAAPFGVPIATGSLAGGTVQVGDVAAVVPEPGAALLFGAGLLVAARRISEGREALVARR